MGRLLLDNGVRLDTDDRTLAHLHRAMLQKLRRGESFHLTWRDDDAIGDGRTTVWITPHTSIVCKLSGPVGALDPAWVEELVVAANSVGGLTPAPATVRGADAAADPVAEHAPLPSAGRQ